MAEASAANPPENETSKSSKIISTYQIGASLYMEEHLSDIIITLIENDTVWRFPAHSIVLAARSKVFHKMLLNDFPEKRTREIRLQDMSPEILKKFLRFLYTGNANLEYWKEACDLLKVGHGYLMEPLVQTCSQYLQEHVDLSNVCYIYRKTATFNINTLRNFCLKVIQSTACIVLRSHEFEFLDEKSVIDVISNPSLNVDGEMCVVSAVLRWAATQCCSQNKSVTEENISQMMIPFVKYLSTESIKGDESETLPKFMHDIKNAFSRQNFCVSQYLQYYANHVNFKIMNTFSNYNQYNFNKVIYFFTFNVNHPLFLIGVNLISTNDFYNDDYLILQTKAANVVTTVLESCIINNTREKYSFYFSSNSNNATLWKTKVLLNRPILLRPHIVYQLGLRSSSQYFTKDGTSKQKTSVIFLQTGLISINNVDYSYSAPFTIHTDSFCGVTELLYLRTPVPAITSYLK